MPYEILLPRPLYRLLSTPVNDGEWIDGVYFGTDPILTYPTFNGDWEPLARGEIRNVLPEGINSTDSIILFSEIELNIATNNNGQVIGGDSIYLEDPTVVTDTFEYVVFDKETWLTNTGFDLLDADTFDYICVRRELQ